MTRTGRLEPGGEDVKSEMECLLGGVGAVALLLLFAVAVSSLSAGIPQYAARLKTHGCCHDAYMQYRTAKA